MDKLFFRRMAEEKGIINNEFTIVVDDCPNFMTVEVVIELIENAPNHEQKTIRNMFSKIDFLNHDLMKYIQFLAKCFVQSRVQA